ncbi:MAG: arsenate reductase ArsC [Pseudomonadota bacterium]
MNPTRVVFVCTGNSVRSQMAEALLREIGEDRFEVASSGVRPAGIHPVTIRVLSEVGIDISKARSKSVDETPFDRFDYVITLCGHAQETCPAIPSGVRTEHWPIDDPIAYVALPEERLQRFRETQETIRDHVTAFVLRWKKKSGD